MSIQNKCAMIYHVSIFDLSYEGFEHHLNTATFDWQKYKIQKIASTGTRTQVPCLEGKDANPYTIDAVKTK